MKRVLIPSTFTADEKNRMLRDYKIGVIARYCATYGVDEIIIYFDEDPFFESHALGKYISKVLKYVRAPPYLRKYLFPKDGNEDLRNVGVIPPVNMPSHAPDFFGLKFREGYAFKDGHVLIDSDKKLIVPGVKRGSVVLVDDSGKLVKTNEYLGYSCKYVNKPLSKVIELLDGPVIGTSRFGENVRRVVIPRDFNLVFGSAYRGLKDLGVFDKCDFVINVVPNQLVKSVRAEEAVAYALTAINLLQ